MKAVKPTPCEGLLCSSVECAVSVRTCLCVGQGATHALRTRRVSLATEGCTATRAKTACTCQALEPVQSN